MVYKGSSAYDEQDFLENYLKRRSRKDSPNNTIEGSAIDLLLGTVKGADILDLGCGDGTYGKELLGRGAISLHRGGRFCCHGGAGINSYRRL